MFAHRGRHTLRGSSVVIVISSLAELIEDQVTKLNNMCVLVVAILNNNDPEIIQQIMNGIDYGMYTVVYCSILSACLQPLPLNCLSKPRLLSSSSSLSL